MYINHTTSRSAGCFTSLATTPAHKVNVVIIAPETEGLHGLILKQNVQFMDVTLSSSIKFGRNNILAFCSRCVTTVDSAAYTEPQNALPSSGDVLLNLAFYMLGRA